MPVVFSVARPCIETGPRSMRPRPSRRWDGVEPAARSSYLRTVMAHLLAHERTSARWRRESVRDVLPSPGLRGEEAR